MCKLEGRTKGRSPNPLILNPKESQRYFKVALGSKKKKKLKKTRSPYCMRGFHLESQSMKKTIDQLSTLLKQNNISLLQGAKKSNAVQPTKDHERCHALKADLTQSKAYLIDSGSSNHMVSSKESFSTLTL